MFDFAIKMNFFSNLSKNNNFCDWIRKWSKFIVPKKNYPEKVSVYYTTVPQTSR